MQAEASVLEAQVALKMLVEQPDLRKAIYTKALKLCQAQLLTFETFLFRGLG